MRKTQKDPVRNPNIAPQAPRGKNSADAENRRYPKEFEIDIFEAWCKSCGICVAFCPRSCLGQSEEGSPVILHPDRCNGCGWCEIHCPDFAISVEEKKPGGPGEGKAS